MNIWKIASRWSDTGTHESTILDIFIKNGIAFIYPEGHDLSSIQIDDLIAISDGHRIVAVAKVATQAQRIADMPGIHLSQTDRGRLGNCHENNIGVRIRFYPATLLGSNESIYYAHTGRFCLIKDPEILERVAAVWEEADSNADRNPFNIAAKTATLDHLLNDPETYLYMIPIFQRPYSWGEQEVERFLRDALTAYRRKETMFIGTMQFSGKRTLSTRGSAFREVIDGQQRLTTCALILKALQLLRPENPQLRELGRRSFDWIETKVSGGEQQKALDLALHSLHMDEPSENGINRFVDNCHQILTGLRNAAIAEVMVDAEGGEVLPVDLDGFAEHFARRLQFVVIETDAGLSRTIQIFNVINTTGLDLNGGDLFKVRAFEYFTDIHQASSECFEEISALYQSIERINSDKHRIVTSINEILGVYQKIIISRHGLPVELARDATETFYERLFDGLLGIKQWTGYKSAVKKDRDREGKRLLDLADLNQLISYRVRADEEWQDLASLDWETRLARHLIRWSRYSGYWVLQLVVEFCYQEEIRINSSLKDQFVQALARLCVVFSVVNARQINEIRTFFAHLTGKMFEHSGKVSIPKSPLNQIIAEILEKISDKEEAFRRELAGHLAGYATAKNLVCRLLEAIETKEISTLQTIFSGGDDIEHIQSYNDTDTAQRETIWGEWGSLINSIGNLMLLEFDLNRSLNNAPFAIKRSTYSTSRFAIARRIGDELQHWNKEAAEDKLRADTAALCEFIFTTKSNTETSPYQVGT